MKGDLRVFEDDFFFFFLSLFRFERTVVGIAFEKIRIGNCKLIATCIFNLFFDFISLFI